MSTIAIAWRAHPDFPLVLLMNHDAPHDRPTATAAWLANAPNCFAGQNEAQGGAWMGVTRAGRYAAVTPFRSNEAIDLTLPSRGQLTLDYLTSEDAPVAYVRQFLRNRTSHPPFNLIVGSTRQAYYAGTKARLPLALTQGVHTVSNGLLDEHWPKCTQLDGLLGAYLHTYGGFDVLLAGHPRLASSTVRGAKDLPKPAGVLSLDDIATASFAMLADRTTYSSGLPDTGVGQEEEERLSACFVLGAEHGTRSGSVLAMARDGSVRYEERSFDAAGNETGRVLETWAMEASVFSGGEE
ncbi:MAG: NRDE family protein [Methylophilaceae bacterium]|nr:NRDE family protein [Methylophilaceae bacterium]